MDPLARLAPAGHEWRLTFDRRFVAEPQRVWEALTQPEPLRAWFPSEIVGERKPGASLTFLVRDEDIAPTHGQVLRYDPPSLFELTWSGDTLRFALADDGEGSRLTVDVFFAERGKAVREGAGWHQCLDRLRAEVDGGVDGRPGAAWSELAQRYREAFGPEAAVIGPPGGWRQPG